jgi:hypothetical protein
MTEDLMKRDIDMADGTIASTIVGHIIERMTTETDTNGTGVGVALHSGTDIDEKTTGLVDMVLDQGLAHLIDKGRSDGRAHSPAQSLLVVELQGVADHQVQIA